MKKKVKQETPIFFHFPIVSPISHQPNRGQVISNLSTNLSVTKMGPNETSQKQNETTNHKRKSQRFFFVGIKIVKKGKT